MKIISLFKDYSIYSQCVLVLLCAAKGMQVKKEWQPFYIRKDLDNIWNKGG